MKYTKRLINKRLSELTREIYFAENRVGNAEKDLNKAIAARDELRKEQEELRKESREE